MKKFLFIAAFMMGIIFAGQAQAKHRYYVQTIHGSYHVYAYPYMIRQAPVIRYYNPRPVIIMDPQYYYYFAPDAYYYIHPEVVIEPQPQFYFYAGVRR